MVTRRLPFIGPVLYGVAWAVVAPAILLWWAIATESAVPLPAVHSPLAGGLLAAAGAAMMALGIGALAVFGKGLPMNAYPPPHYVARGIYGWVSHPIYVGFIVLSAGAAVAFGSASGLWLVTPAAALALAALVFGYEGPDLSHRFGHQVQPPRLALPRAGDGAPSPWERAAVYLLVLLPWLLVYEAVQLFGVPRDAVSSYLPFEYGWPVIEWTEAIYASTYLLVIVTPLAVKTRQALRRFTVTGLIATAAVTFIYITVPLAAEPRQFEPTTLLGHLTAFERTLSGAPGAFPAFHVIWPLICADAWRSRGRGWGIAVSLYAALIGISCVTIGMHSIADVVSGALLFPVFRRYDAIWAALRRLTERLANSWREWRIGPVRIINHGFYTGLGGAVGTWIACRLAGADLLLSVVVVGLVALVCSVLWAQYLEGSSILLRPLGWYGGIIGGLLAMAVLALLDADVLALMGALAVAVPWVQALGRLRCLVQGCCHGGPAPPELGIRYLHSRSRVTCIAGLAGVPIYPTPLYSILSNVFTGLLLYRLWMLGASPSLVTGAYFILNSVARFVEEAYRAEPQTPVCARLHLYQWIALAGFAIGIFFTTLKVVPPPVPLGAADPRILAGAVLVGVIGWFVTGVDFPQSSRRFSRLAPADDPPRLLKPR